MSMFDNAKNIGLRQTKIYLKNRHLFLYHLKYSNEYKDEKLLFFKQKNGLQSYL